VTTIHSNSILRQIFQKFLPDIVPHKLADKHRPVAGFLFEEVFVIAGKWARYKHPVSIWSQMRNLL